MASNNMKLLNRGANGLPTDISLGGLPLFNDDLTMLQQNAIQFGIPSLLRGFSCVLSGCLVDSCNTSTKKLDLTEGYVMIDNIIYYIPRLTNQTYPFSIIAGAQTIDQRIFQNGETKDVAIEYSYAITTSFTFGANQNYPNELLANPKMVYFDPFTAQRANYILDNMSRSNNDIKFSISPITNITNTETGKLIVGGSLSAVSPYNVAALKWKYLGWSPFIGGAKYLRVASPSIPLTTGGRSSFILNKNNIPSHVHNVNIDTNTKGSHSHTVSNITKTDGGNNYGWIGKGNGSWPDGRNPNNSITIDNNGDHFHNVNGTTQDGTSDGLLLSPVAINLDPLYTDVYYYRWIGWNFIGNINNYGYRFWDVNYPPLQNNM